MTDMPQQKQFFRVAVNGFTFGQVLKAGDYVLLYPEQAQYYLAPYAAQLEPVETIADGGVAADLSVFRALWHGAASADPPATKDGVALPQGAEYWNTTTQRVRVLAATGWQDKDAAAFAARDDAQISAGLAAEHATYAESARRDAVAARQGMAASAAAAVAEATATATAAAATATTKAQIASDKADLATTKAQLASDKADLATTKAQVATDEAAAATGAAATATAQATAASGYATAAAAAAGHNKGAYASLAALQAAVPAGAAADFAILTHGAGVAATIAVWDSDNSPAGWVDTQSAAPTSIDWSAVTNKPAGVLWNSGGIIVQFVAAAATDIPGVDKGAAGQTANLREWRKSDGTVVASVDANGKGFFSALRCDGVLSATSSGWGTIAFGGVNVGANNFAAIRDGGVVVTRGDGCFAFVAPGSQNPYSAATTAALSQPISGVVEVNNGTAGTLRDLRARNIDCLQIRQLQLELAELRLARTSFANGWIDSLNGTGDLATLTNCDTSVAGKITPTYTPGVNQIPVMTGATTSGVTISDTAHYAGRDAWHACDATIGTSAGNCWDTYPAMSGSMTTDFGVAKTISTIALSAANGLNAGWTLQGSNDNAAWTTLLTGAAVSADTAQHVYAVTSPGAYRYYKFTGTATSGSSLYLDQFELRPPPVYNNLTLISNTFASTSVPSVGLVIAQIKAIDALVMGTDILAYFSRDGGTTWTAVTLTADEAPGDGTTIYSGSVSVTGQPSGTAPKVKLVSANAKSFELFALGGFYS